jgi:acyl carrier protein
MAGNEVMKEAISKALVTVIEEMNEERDDDAQLGTQHDSTLYGTGGNLDSLDLVRLVVLLEQQIDDDLGRSVSIADDRAMSQENSHFNSVGALVDHVANLLEE